MYEILKEFALPPANIVLLLIVGLILLHRGCRRAGLAVNATACALLYLFSTPYIAGTLGRFIETVPSLSDESAVATGAQAIVILSAGAHPYAPEYGGQTVDQLTLERLRYAAHLYRIAPLPILVSGGDLMGIEGTIANLMKVTLDHDFQIPVKWVENRSSNTFENAQFSADILKRNGVHKIILVTHAGHMARAMRVFEAQGLEVVPAPTGFTSPSRTFLNDYLPRGSGLRETYYALYEIIGWEWYKVRYRRN